MNIKLLMTWNIRPGREQEYFEYVVREFIPDIQKLGLEPSDAWFTVYGSDDQSQIMAAFKSNNLSSLRRALRSSDWDHLTTRLLDFVENLSYKIVPARKGFQM